MDTVDSEETGNSGKEKGKNLGSEYVLTYQGEEKGIRICRVSTITKSYSYLSQCIKEVTLVNERQLK